MLSYFGRARTREAKRSLVPFDVKIRGPKVEFTWPPIPSALTWANRFKVRFAVGIGWPKKFHPAYKLSYYPHSRGPLERPPFARCRGLLPFGQPICFVLAIADRRVQKPQSTLTPPSAHCACSSTLVRVFQAGATSRGYFALPSPPRGPSDRFP